MAANNNSLMDYEGDSSDWIEIWNKGTDPVNLGQAGAEWRLTNKADNLTKWTFPDVTLAANGYLVVFASGKNEVMANGEIHTNFKLSADGDYLALVDPSGNKVSEFDEGASPSTFPAQSDDVSYGTIDRTSDTTLVATGASTYILVPTDGSMETSGSEWYRLDPDFDYTNWLYGQTALGYETAVVMPQGSGTFCYAPYGAGGTWNLYELVTSTKTWTAAKADAEARTQGGKAGHLVSISSSTENAFVKSLLTSSAWIGLNDSAVEGTFVWTTGEPVTYTRWGSSQPDGIPSGGSTVDSGVDAVRMNNSDGKWYDEKINNSSVKYGYVVEYELNLPSLGPAFTVTEAHATKGVYTTTNAVSLLASPAAQTYAFPFINFADPENVAGGRFIGNFAFGGNTSATDTYFAMRATAIVEIPTTGTYTFGVKSDDGFSLKIDGATFTSFTVLQGSAGEFTVSGDTLAHPTTGACEAIGVTNLTAGEHEIELVFFQSTSASGVELYAAQGAKTAWDSAAFRLVGDVIHGGLPIRGIGDAVTTNISAAMQGLNTTAYVRIPFTVDDPTQFDQLTLRLKYGDGFVAYLNSQEVASANAPTTLAYNSAATGENPYYLATQYVDFSISQYRDLLVAGDNVLAIRLLNKGPVGGANDLDCLLDPQLIGGKLLSTALRFFTTPTPGLPNNQGVVETVADVKFSKDHGFCDAPLDLALSCSTPGAQIRYTLDFTAPTATTGTAYAGPIHITTTTVVRAAAFLADWDPCPSISQTYIFLDDVLTQPALPAGFPAQWVTATGTVYGYPPDYGMDDTIVNDPRYAATLREDLQMLPTLSIVAGIADIFGPTGIYPNAYLNNGDLGSLWAVASSTEFIDPNGGPGFEIDNGLRIYGGVNRSPDFPKHSFRLDFKSDYGPAKLDFDLFNDPTAVTSFDTLILRGEFNNSWPYRSNNPAQQARGIMTRDQWMRQAMADMGDPSSHHRYVHLYIDGLYWGIYTITERPDNAFQSSYFGGSKDQWDVNHDANFISGDAVNWNAMMAVVNDGTKTAGQKFQILKDNYIDITEYIDYMILNMYGNNNDWDDHNWYAARERAPDGRWRFFVWDGERVLEDPGENSTITLNKDNRPSHIYNQIKTATEFKLLWADRLQKAFFNGGALTPETTAARMQALQNIVDPAIVCESARWGDFNYVSPFVREPPFTRDNEYLVEMTRLYTEYFPVRTAFVLGQFVSNGLYPSVGNLKAAAFYAPTFSQLGGEVAPGFTLTLSNPNATGTIYYTLDGTDPRATGGAVAGLTCTAPISITQSATVRARIYDGTVWSALMEVPFYVDTPLRITEIMYNPPNAPAGNPYPTQAFEYIELQNIGSAALALAGMSLTGGVSFTFTSQTLAAGECAVVVADPDAFASRYGAGPRILGTYAGALGNAGEALQLLDAAGQQILQVRFKDGWYPLTDGAGFSLVAADPMQARSLFDSNDGWRTSWQEGGNPGAADAGVPDGAIVVNEVVAHQDLEPPGDWIELYNTTGAAVNLGGWFLSDSDLNLMKYRIADDTCIPAYGYAVFYESTHFGNAADPGCLQAFALSELGETVYLTSVSAPGVLGGYRYSEKFGASDQGYAAGDVQGVAFVRYLKSTGAKDFVYGAARTPGAANAAPLVGPVVINEVMYNPADPAATRDEFLELYNISDSDVLLYDPLNPANTWKFTDGIDFAFPTGASIPAHGYALVVGIDPALFRMRHPDVPPSVTIYGPYGGRLNDAGETIELSRPGQPDPGTPTVVPYYRADQVTYGISGSWPRRADGLGSSLERVDPASYGNDPANWAASTNFGTPGRANVFLDSTAPSAPTGVSTAAASETTMTVAWTPSADPESGVAYYKIYRDGVNVGASASTTFTDIALAPATNYTYAVSAVDYDGLEGAQAAALAPARIVVLSSATGADTTTIKAVFGETVWRDSAQVIGNYVVTYSGGQKAVTEVALLSDQKTVLITLASAMTVGTTYTVTASNVLAQSGYTVAPNTAESFAYSTPASNLPVYALREYWLGISGAAVTNLTGNANYPYNPSAWTDLTGGYFEAPSNFGDSYGERLRAYITPTTTGNYTFYIASDDYSELWLSTNDQPANAVKIAYVSGHTSSRQWDTYASQKSAAISLTAGTKYYIEVRHKEGTGGDNVAVTWVPPGGTYSSGQAPIASSYLTPYLVPSFTVSVSALSPTVSEGGPGSGTFRITRSNAADPLGMTKALTVNYTVTGTAFTSDYSENLGWSITIPAGATYLDVNVTPVNDSTDEPNETVKLNILSDIRYSIGTASATLTILDDDLPTVSVAATKPDASEAGPTPGTWTFTRVGDLTAPLTVKYAVTGGTATPDDYQPLAGSVMLGIDQATATVDLIPVDNGVTEPDKTVVLAITADPAYTVTGGPATVTINEFPVVTAVRLNNRSGRGPGAVDPSGLGVRTIAIDFSEPVAFAQNDVMVQTVAFPNGSEQVTKTVTTAVIGGSGTGTMTITLPFGEAMDTWVKVRLSGSAIADLRGHRLDGDPRSGNLYIVDAADDLPTGDGAEGGDAVFYVGSLRGDMDLDGQVTAADKAAFMTKWQAKDLDADFRGVGFGVRPPDGKVTLGDIDGFTSLYLAASAAGRSLATLPAGHPLSGGVTPLPVLPARSADIDILAEAAGRLMPTPILPGSGALVAATSSNGVTITGSSTSSDDPASDPLKVRQAYATDDGTGAVLRI
jgi:hypothetical protein